MSAGRATIGGIVTLIGVTCAAYLLADVAHETLGHGGACLALGGKLLFVSSTFEDCSIHSRIIDGAGPVMGILAALAAWGWLAIVPPRELASRMFLLLTFAFAIFWNVFYLIRSGVTDQGDWAFVIAGLEPKFLWHSAIAVLGIAAYALAMRVLAQLIRTHIASPDGAGLSPLAVTGIAFAAAIVVSAIAAHFDQRPVAPDFLDSLPTALSAFGLFWVGATMTRRDPGVRIASPQSVGWIVAGAAAASVLIGMLGPGVRF